MNDIRGASFAVKMARKRALDIKVMNDINDFHQNSNSF